MASNATPPISLSACGKRFGDRWLWRDVNVEVQPGEIVALIGPSGSGKSTLLNCAGMLDRPTEGTVSLLGQDVTRVRDRTVRKLRAGAVGYVFQDFALIDSQSAGANVELALGPAMAPAARRRRRRTAAEALQSVGLGGRGREPAYRLSGGEQQRVALARLIARRPAVILADEPTGSLDQANAKLVLGLLRDLATNGAGILIATHSQLAISASDRVVDLAAYRTAPQDEPLDPVRHAITRTAHRPHAPAAAPNQR